MITKTQCQHCGGPLEFEAEDYVPGSEVECPHCQQATSLRLPPRVKLPRRPRAWAVRIAVGLAIVAGAGLLVKFLVVPFFALPVEQAANIIGAVAILGVGLLCLMVIILWIIFPVFVYFGLAKVRSLLERIERNTRG